MKAEYVLFFLSLLITGWGQQNPVYIPDMEGRLITGRSGTHHWQPYMAQSDMSDYSHASPEAYEAFMDLKYGLRIHWGIYALVHGRESWIINKKNTLAFQGMYHDLYKGWCPADFNAAEWADIMKENGFKFFVFTTKHHDGFSMYDTKTKIVKRTAFFGPDSGKIETCDLHYSIMETPFGRDVTRELVDAARSRGLRIGLYFSHPDWYDADFRFDQWNPNRDTAYTPQHDPQAWARFEKRHQTQLEELLTQYGQVDMLSLDMWFPDFAWPHQQALIKDLRKIQPDCMFRWRGIGNFGDYHTPENYIPGAEGQGTMPWQVIHTLSRRGIFSYEPDATYLRSGSWIIEKLIDIVSKGGNFMVGIGPDLTGKFHPKALEAIAYAGKWLKINGESIYKTRPWKYWQEGDSIRFTRSKDNKTVYIISLKWPGDKLVLQKVLPVPGTKLTMLGVEKSLEWHQQKERLIIKMPEELRLPENRPCRQAYVFKVTVKK